ncbi:TPR-like protein, partial [Coemansia reversa NRRL 1564]
SKPSIEQLLTKTQELMDDNNYEDALKVVIQAIGLDERNDKALLLAAVIQLESGDVEPAINCLLRCVEISPERGFEKYMYLGQFTIELESVRYYQLGVDALQRDLDEVPKDSEHSAALRRKMAEAYVAMTEIFLTDCCFESNAEEKCEEYLKLGATADPSCPEVYQTMASVRLSQDRPKDARECLTKSLALWSDKDQNDPTQIPSYDNRLGLVRLLLELDDKDQALSILERLQKEDDENVDLWYLYGWTYHLQSEEAGQSADEKTETLVSARECFRRAIKLAELQDFENDGLIEHACELVARINATVPASADEDE